MNKYVLTRLSNETDNAFVQRALQIFNTNIYIDPKRDLVEVDMVLTPEQLITFNASVYEELR